METESFAENAADEVIRHRLALLRFETSTTRSMLTAYDDALKDVQRAFGELYKKVQSGASLDRAQLERLTSLSTDLTKRMKELQRVLSLTLEGRLQEAGDAEIAFQRRLFNRLSVDRSFSTAPDGTVTAALTTPIGGERWNARLKVDLKEAHDGVQAVLAKAVAKGSSIPEVATALRTGPKIVETYRGRLVNIARTEVQRVANTAAHAVYEENLDVLSGVQWLATLDSRTCVICAPLHNKVYKYDLEGNLPADYRPPPAHPRCRCFASPITKDWADLGFDIPKKRRDVYSSKPADDTSFDAWLAKQSKAEQAEFFGSDTAHEAWKAGAPLSGFSDAGKPLGVGELRSRYL